MKVFISYAKEDIEIAKKLRDDLEKAGIKTWLGEEDLLPGQNFREIIPQEIRESNYFIALLSSKSVSKRGFVQKELKTALDILDEFPKNEIFIIPVRLDTCEPRDEKLRNIHIADLFPNYGKGLNKILKALDIELGPLQPLQKTTSEYMGCTTLIAIIFLLVFLINTEIGSRIVNKSKEIFQTIEIKSQGDKKIGLMWCKSESEEPLTYKEAKSYIKKLNNNGFANYNNWRLPTVDELKSLLIQKKQSNGNPKKYWTSEQRESDKASVIDFENGKVGWSFTTDENYVRAVRSRQ